MNRAIQENLKPRRIYYTNKLVEILFDDMADLKKNFESAIKIWRIMEPSIIKVVNFGLSDDDIQKLTDFLCDKNLI